MYLYCMFTVWLVCWWLLYCPFLFLFSFKSTLCWLFWLQYERETMKDKLKTFRAKLAYLSSAFSQRSNVQYTVCVSKWKYRYFLLKKIFFTTNFSLLSNNSRPFLVYSDQFHYNARTNFIQFFWYLHKKFTMDFM